MITNKLEELEQLDNEIMELSTDEEEMTNILVASTVFEVEVQEALSVTEEFLTIQYILKENLIKVACMQVRHV